MDELLVKLRKTYPTNYAEIKKAHDFAEQAHRGQKEVRGRIILFIPARLWKFLPISALTRQRS